MTAELASNNSHGELAIDTTTVAAALRRQTGGSEIREILAIAAGQA